MSRKFFLILILLLLVCDANGSLKITKDPGTYASLDEKFHWQLEWTLAEEMPEGTLFELRSKCMRTYYRWAKTDFELTNAEVIEVIPSSGKNLWSNTTWTNVRAELTRDLKTGDKVKISFDSTASHFAGRNDEVSIWVAEPADDPNEAEFQKIENTDVTLKVKSAPVANLYLYCEPTPGHDNKIRTIISPEDRFGNASEFKNPVTVKFNWMGNKFEEEIYGTKKIYLETPEKQICRLKATVSYRELASFEDIENGKKDYGQITVISNPVWISPPESSEAAFGEFHWHTEFSGDGAYPVRNGLKFARDQMNMNFCMPSDHTPNEYWDETVDIVEKFNEDNKFATIFGWEKSTKWGHENYYFTKSDHFVNPTNPEGPLMGNEWEDKLWVLQKTLNKQFKKTRDFIAIPHHTNVSGAPHWFPYPFDKVKPSDYHRLIEVFQCRGNQERNTYSGNWRKWRALHFNNNSSVQDALAKGFKMGFVAGTDNHAAYPSKMFCAKPGYGKMPLNSTGLTGVWVDKITRQDVFDGMFARNTWAVWDTRALVYFTVNGEPMGSEIKVNKGDDVKARIKISAEAPLETIEIISEAKTVWEGSAGKPDIDKKVELGKIEIDTYFYLRAMQEDGALIYASPVFVEVD